MRSTRTFSTLSFVVFGINLLLGFGCSTPVDLSVLGAYRFEDGRLLSIRRSTDRNLRARFFDNGESYRLHPDGHLRYTSGPGFSASRPVVLEVELRTDASGLAKALVWKASGEEARVAVAVGREESVSFPGDGVSLEGRLRFPDGPGPHPAVVLVHGSGSQAATEYFYNGDFLAARGIATLTFDKRGTGRSTGRVSFDFHRLAADVVAAVDFLHSRSEIDSRRIGLSGYSQGAWVAPLAASMSADVAFVVAQYGLIASPTEEARVETRNLLRERGVDEQSLDQVDELTRAAVGVVANNFRSGWEELEEVRERYRGAGWWDKLEGTTVGKMVSYPRWLIKLIGPRQSLPGLDWSYDSEALLAELDVPMVWLVAGADRSAPPELTLPALERLQKAGRPIETVVFPGVDHAMLEFEEVEGERVYSGYASDYFRTEVEVVRRLAGVPLPGRVEPPL